eukprot:GHVU01097856.1.p1 GENE.GHVU01097856.1~~GHVU01097856.1.p1  ORF type:complete len:101 (+),score=2.35 GHVU01097856.1:987-1289(+)
MVSNVPPIGVVVRYKMAVVKWQLSGVRRPQPYVLWHLLPRCFSANSTAILSELESTIQGLKAHGMAEKGDQDKFERAASMRSQAGGAVRVAARAAPYPVW